MIGKVVLVAVALFCVVWAENLGYNGYKVYRIQPKGEQQRNELLFLGNIAEVDFWSEVNHHGKPVDVMIPPNIQPGVQSFLITREIEYTILIDDVQKVVDDEVIAQKLQPSPKAGKISFQKYNTYTEINSYMKQLAKDHPDKVSLEQIGKTSEGRELNVIKISTNPSANKPVIFIDAAIHAREWIAPALATFAIQQLVENAGNSQLLEKIDWHILPVINPDGYEYTHSSSSRRLWRKNRSKGTRCYGADPNRNFPFKWGGAGTSGDECSDIYRGRSAGSELEAQALMKYISNNKRNIKLYLSFHSYGNYVLYPWGYSTQLPENVDELHALGELVANSMHKVLGNTYTVGSSATALYPAAGGSDDWSKAVAGVELAYTVELSAGGSSGFDPPPRNILPFVTEGWEGLKAYHHYIKNKFT